MPKQKYMSAGASRRSESGFIRGLRKTGASQDTIALAEKVERQQEEAERSASKRQGSDK